MPSGKQGKAYSIRTVFLMILLCAGALFAVSEWVFTVRNVAVEGNRRVPAAQIAELAGLSGHRSWLFVREETVRSGVESNRYLVFESMEKVFPNRIVIHVRERTPRAWMNALGRRYAIDEEGVVLDTLAEGASTDGMLALTGLSVREMGLGDRLSYVNSSQMHAYTDLMAELLVQNAADTFTAMNVADSSNVYLTSASGFEISLGKAEDFRAKLLSVRGVLEYAEQFALKSGMLDASVPGYVTYSP